MNVGSIIVQVGANLSALASGLNNARRQANQAANSMQQSFSNAFNAIDDQGSQTANALARHFQEVGRIVSGILISQAFYNAMNDIEQATKAVFEHSMALEDASIKWTRFLDSAEESSKWLRTLQEYAHRTPFDFATVEQGTSLIRLMGVETEAIIPIFDTLGNAISMTGGDNQDMRNTIRALSQMWKSPKAQAEEMEQFVENQIDAYRYVSEQLGITQAQAKEIGDTGISGRKAATAILKGLATDENFINAMEEMNQTTRGSINSIKEMSIYLASGLFDGAFDGISEVIKNIRKDIEHLVEVFDTKGVGGFFEEIVPEHLQEDVRTLVAVIKYNIESLKMIFKSLGPGFTAFADALVKTFAVILPLTAQLLRAFALLLQSIEPVIPLLGKLAFAIAAAGMYLGVAAGFKLLATAIKTLFIAGPVARAITLLGRAVFGAFALMTAHPAVAIITVIGGALIYLALQSERATIWLERLMARVQQFMGFNTSDILQPIDNDPDGGYYEQMTQDLLDVIDSAGGAEEAVDDAMDGAGKGAKKAKKEMDKFLASFDEVYQVPEKHDAGSGGGPGGGGPGKDGWEAPTKIEVPELVVPPTAKIDLPPMDFDAPELPPIDWTPWIMPPGLFTPIGAVTAALKELLKIFDGFRIPLPSVLVGDFIKGFIKEWSGGFDSLLGTVGDFVKEVSGVMDSLVPKLLPALGPMGAVAGLVLGLPKYFEEAWERIRTSVRPLTEGLMTAFSGIKLPDLGPVFSNMWEGVKSSFSGFLGWVSGNWKGLLLGAIAAVVLGVAIYFFGLPAIIAAALATLSRVVLTSFRTLGPLIMRALSNLPKTLRTIWNALPQGLKTSIDDVGKALSKVPGQIANFLRSVPGILKGVFDKLPANVQTVLTAVGNHFSRLPTSIWNFIKSIPGKLKDTVKNFPADSKKFIDDAVSKFTSISTKVWEKVKTIPTKLKDAVKDFPKEAKKAIDGTVNYFKELPGKIWEAIKSIPSKIKEAFGNIKVPKFDVGMSGVSVKWAPVAGFANGGVIGKDSIVRVGEKGRREAIVPLQNETAMAPFADAVANRMIKAGSMGGQSSQPTVYVGTLIADDRSLRELERRMQVIRLNEAGRGIR